MDRFLEKLLSYESGICPEDHEFYKAHYERPIVSYWKVDEHRRVRRNPVDGKPLGREPKTIREYLSILGVEIPRDSINQRTLRRARYAATNPWGFIGFQFGEAILCDTGHYTPERVIDDRAGAGSGHIEAMYSAEVPDAVWSNGRSRYLFTDDAAGTSIIATPTNEWRGRFSGKGGIWSLSDLKRPVLQQTLIRYVMRHNFLLLINKLQEMGETEVSAMHILGQKLGLNLTLSSVLSGCHLSGVNGLIDFIVAEKDRKDEAGTYLSEYLIRFNGLSVGKWIGAGAAR